MKKAAGTRNRQKNDISAADGGLLCSGWDGFDAKPP
jgi:hypothetical protein